jgi:hypothetical protein
LIGGVYPSKEQKRQFFRGVTKRIIDKVQSLLLGKGLHLHGHIPDEIASSVFHVTCAKFKEVLHRGRLAGVSDVTEHMKAIAMEGEYKLKGTVVKVEGDNVYVDIVDFGSTGLENKFIKRICAYSNPEGLDPCGTVWINLDEVCITRTNGESDVLAAIPMNKVRRDPDWIRALIVKMRPYELPVFANVEVFSSMLQQFVKED